MSDELCRLESDRAKISDWQNELAEARRDVAMAEERALRASEEADAKKALRESEIQRERAVRVCWSLHTADKLNVSLTMTIGDVLDDAGRATQYASNV